MRNVLKLFTGEGTKILNNFVNYIKTNGDSRPVYHLLCCLKCMKFEDPYS